MKKVRFETPSKSLSSGMDESECHFPRPFMENKASIVGGNYANALSFSSDPVNRYENSNSSPYPIVNKTTLSGICNRDPKWLPSNDLNLSMLDASSHEPRQLVLSNVVSTCGVENRNDDDKTHTHILSSIENSKKFTPPNILNKNNDFFLKRDNLDRYQMDPLQNQFKRLNLGKENDPIAKKAEIRMGVEKPVCEKKSISPFESPNMAVNNKGNECSCHHCIKNVQNYLPPQFSHLPSQCQNIESRLSQCNCALPLQSRGCLHYLHYKQSVCKICHCHTDIVNTSPLKPQNAVDKKTWAIEKYEENKKVECLDVEKQTNIVKEKREPTVVDLFKIIKLQNEQLQLLQEKVDKFISVSKNGSHNAQPLPGQNYMTERVALQTIDSDISQEHKISIGVMTSFEMVRTSTVINKEFVKQTMENAQIQCNRSQISIKEVVSKSQPVNLNFLDGIIPVGKSVQSDVQTSHNIGEKVQVQTENVNDEKTLNEFSLYNVQVDNATTPQISPEQSMYLDVRDYSDSESGSDDQSNVGWTYYNKVMTHVNGMLQDSDMPSSASALYRNTRQQCVQMQIDKTNLSVTKRVKFGDDPLGIHQPHIYVPSTDTSIKMNQLAAKYLKTTPQTMLQRPVTKPTTKNIDMSFATRNYMERHKLLKGLPTSASSPPTSEMPRFLDVTALKQQPKLL